MEFCVVMTVGGRSYIEPVLASWSRVRGGPDVEFVFSCEPEAERSAELCEDFLDYAPGSIVINREQYGVVKNTKSALEAGFAFSDFVVCTEDDVTVSDDILEYFRFAAYRYLDDKSIAGVCAFTNDGPPNDHEVFRYPFFSPLAWGTWADRWPQLSREWGGLNSNPRAWDRRIQIYQTLKHGRDFIFPCTSRSQHIGEHGLHAGDPEWYEQTVSKTFRPHYEPGAFSEIEVTVETHDEPVQLPLGSSIFMGSLPFGTPPK